MLQIFKPKSKLLENYIDFYYIFDHERSENISYIAFPHVNTAISFFKNVEIKKSNHEINITSTSQHKNNYQQKIKKVLNQAKSKM